MSQAEASLVKSDESQDGLLEDTYEERLLSRTTLSAIWDAIRFSWEGTQRKVQDSRLMREELYRSQKLFKLNLEKPFNLSKYPIIKDTQGK